MVIGYVPEEYWELLLFLYPKRNIFQPRIQHWHKTQWTFDGTPDAIYHLIISRWYLISQAFREPDVKVCTIYTFEVELYTIYNYNNI
jgi:hypothetical protein